MKRLFIKMMAFEAQLSSETYHSKLKLKGANTHHNTNSILGKNCVLGSKQGLF